MKAQKLQGREGRKNAKLFLLVALFICLMLQPLQAETWTSGHHEIYDGNVYGEIWMYNDCTLDIFGGDIYRLAVYDTTITDWYDGSMDVLWVNNNSIVNMYEGSLGELAAIDNGLINLYAHDVTHTTTGGFYQHGQVMGKYYSDDAQFCFDLCNQEAYSHINIVPEPATFLLLSLGILGIRRKN
jgi:hypothetical protein